MSVSIRAEFRRSVHLERDFHDRSARASYIITGKAREVLSRVFDSLSVPVAQRAWSITGPYGTGKSAFMLFLAQLLRGDESAIRLLEESDSALATRYVETVSAPFLPILLVGTRNPLVKEVADALSAGIAQFLAGYRHRRGRRPARVAQMMQSLESIRSRLGEELHTEDAIVQALAMTSSAVSIGVGGGVLLVVDELGKMLEYAAMHPAESDVFLLQRIAERASRGAADGSEAAPILFFTVLHQSFERYAARLGTAHRDEWRKVQGRFEDVAFLERTEEIVRLLARAIQSDQAGPTDESIRHVHALLQEVSLPAGISQERLEKWLIDALPVDPAVALLVGPLFRRLAQNERSLFAFLASGEAHSFVSVVNRPSSESDGSSSTAQPTRRYRLDNLYDYLVATLGGTLHSARMERLWTETESALTRLSDSDPLYARLVKQAALIGYAGGLAGIASTQPVLSSASGADGADVSNALQVLKDRRILSYRSFSETYHVWQGSDFDLDGSLQKAKENLPLRIPLADLLSDALPTVPMVARRHSFETGTNRVFEVRYANQQSWRESLILDGAPCDGRVVFVIPEAEIEADQLRREITSESADPLVLVAIPRTVPQLRAAARELAALDWVWENEEQVQGDPVARRELSEQRSQLAAELQSRLDTLLEPTSDGGGGCIWVVEGSEVAVRSERELQEMISGQCDRVFSQTPRVWNEMLNRSKPSSSAIRGLKQLLWAMLTRHDQLGLGIEGTPAEYAMYVSVLRENRLHVPDGDGRWRFVAPEGDRGGHLLPAWAEIDRILESSEGRPIPVGALFDALKRPPFGMRWGIVPVLFFAFVLHHRNEIAFYEDGTFARNLSFETLERLLKSYEKGQDTFHVQLVRLDEHTEDLLRLLSPVVGIGGDANHPLPIAIRLLQRVHDLPNYVRRTSRLSDLGVRVRSALEQATDPSRLVLEELPKACGEQSFLGDRTDDGDAVRRYVDGLQQALRELNSAYESLLTQIHDDLSHVLGLRGNDLSAHRSELASRARVLLPATTDIRLKAFLVRAANEMLSDDAWLESVATLLVRQPPAEWGELDYDRFRVELFTVARDFQNLEPLAFDFAHDLSRNSRESNGEGSLRRIRLFVKALNETEQDGVIHVHPEDDILVHELHDQLRAQLLDNELSPDLKLAALGRLVSDLLESRVVKAVEI